MNRPLRGRRRHVADINVVPYIDVMLVLLVIFMISTPLINQGVEINLPKAQAKALPPSQIRTLILEVDRHGAYFVHQVGASPQPMTPQQALTYASAVLRRQPRTPVVVKADAAVNYGKVIQAMVLLQKAGAPQVGLSTQPPPAPAQS